MSKPSNREKILTEGLKVVHERGFAGASVRDIIQAAGVPLGSFSNHFASKEAFGLEIIERYFGNSRDLIARTLRNDDLPPLQRLGDYITASKNKLCANGTHNGCLFGNFTAESADRCDAIRVRLAEIFAEVRASLAYCLKAAVAAGEVTDDLDCEEVAGFIHASLQGALLLAKAERSPAPVERLQKILFSTILRPAVAG